MIPAYPLSVEEILKIVAANTPGRINLSLGDLDRYIAVVRAALTQQAAPTLSSSECGTAFDLLREVLAQHDEQGAHIRAEGDYPVPNPLAERIRALLNGVGETEC